MAAIKQQVQDEPDPLVLVSGLNKSFDGVPILKNVSFSLCKGDLVCIIGNSGCGKTTLLRCLNCLEVPDSGTISVDGITVSIPSGGARMADFHEKANALRKKAGMVFQGFNLFPHKTVIDNITLALQVVKKQPPEQSRDAALHILRKVGLEKFKDRYPDNLSGGQKQRAAIARALAMSPQVMLYDEPTSSLDPELATEVIEVMRNLDAEGMTQMVVTHEARFARKASDYIIYMEHGEIVEMSGGSSLFHSPSDERTRRFVSHFS